MRLLRLLSAGLFVFLGLPLRTCDVTGDHCDCFLSERRLVRDSQRSVQRSSLPSSKIDDSMVRLGGRGRLVRRLVTASLMIAMLGCEDRFEPPEPEEISRPTELPSEFEQYRERIESSRRPYIRIEPRLERANDLLASKFRGVPWMTDGEEIPVDKRGEPLVLLAQINFEETPPLEGFPDAGLVQFWIQHGSNDEHVWGMPLYDADPWNAAESFQALQRQDYFRIRYYPSPSRDGARDMSDYEPYRGFEMPITEEMSLHFSLGEDLVNMEDHSFSEVFGLKPLDLRDRHPDAPFDQLRAYLADDSAAKIGGYGRFVQGDPRTAAEDGHEWVVLLNIESVLVGSAEILWGDNGTATFLIRRDDLARRDFSQVVYYWDNH